MDGQYYDASNATAGEILHPYFPLSVKLPNYAANDMSSFTLVSSMVSGCSLIFAVTHLLVRRIRPAMSMVDELATMWFAMCGFMHLFFEGYFALNSLDMAGRTDLFGQLWKEYSLSDSRYLTQDAFLVCMESVTAFLWGPLSFACAYCIITDNPARHSLQSTISLGQIYGNVLYLGTCTFNELVHSVVYCRPERFYYYMYYLLCNGFWIVIPFPLLYQSWVSSTRAFAQVKTATMGKKSL